MYSNNPIHEAPVSSRRSSAEAVPAGRVLRIALFIAAAMLGVVALARAADVPAAPTDALSQLSAQFQTATAQNDANGDAQTQNIGQALGGLLNSLGGAMGGNTPVTPVDFRSLQALLPDALPGLKRMNAGGANKQGMGIKTATAQAEYHGAGSQLIRVSIADVSGVSGVLDLAGALPKDTDAASDDGYEKDVTIGGRSMHEKYTKASQQSTLSVIVARRFDVEIEGTAVTMDAVHDAMTHVDLKRLESMKSQGVQQK
jgi:hypothetical protein